MKHLSFCFQILAVAIFLSQCNPPETDFDDAKKQFEAGNFSEAEKILKSIQPVNISDSLAFETEVMLARIERMGIDFSKSESKIREQLAEWYPEITDEQLRKWETSKKLEMKVIDGERRYFKNAVPNLFRLDNEAKKIREKKNGHQPDMLDTFCLEHTTNLIEHASNGTDLLAETKKIRIEYSITLNADVIPSGETVKCWMPFPKVSLPRQKNIKLLNVNADKYTLADSNAMQRSLYIEKIAVAGQPVIFHYSAEFETSPQYFNPGKLKPNELDKNSDIFKKFTTERKPHIVFSDKIKHLTDSLIAGKTSQIDKMRSIFYWIDKNFPWASALEYSTIPCIPEYVLENGHGDCGMKTLLFMTMARYAGIPCKWQSGWMLHPGELNLHDWCEVYFEGTGWVPVDQSFGLQNSGNISLKEFYMTGIDEFRMIVNDDYGSEFSPSKNYFRSEPIDFQRGELEWKGGNLYFNKWDYHMEVTFLN